MNGETMWRPLAIAAVGAAVVAGAADLLFWGAEPGLSVAIFAAVLGVVVLVARRVEGKGIAAAWPIGALLVGAAVAAAVDFGFANFCVMAVLFTVLAGETFYGDRPRLWARALSQVAALLRFPVALPRLGMAFFRLSLSSPVGTASQVARVAAIVVPALGIGLLFALLLGAGNAVFGSWFGEAWHALCQWLNTLSFGRLCFALFTASMALALIVPACIGPKWWAWVVPGEAPAPVAPPHYLHWQAVAVLGIVNLLFVAANGADAVYLWAQRAIPPGVNAATYVHEGTWALVAAVLLAAAVLALLFRRRGALLPQRAPRLLAYAWIGQCLFLLASVVLRLILYVQEFGLSKTRVELACFLLLVGVGFALLAAKIARDKSLRWLVGANAVSTFVLFYAVQFWDMGEFVACWNVDRWETHPGWKLDVDYLAAKEMGSGAWKELRRVADSSREPEASQARNLLRQKWEGIPALSWRSWQAREAWSRKYLGDTPPPALADPDWESALFLAEEGLSLLLERHHNATPLDEFQRKLVVRFPDGRTTSMDLSEDTGGTVQMNVYRDSEGRYLLRDRLEYHQVDPGAGEICLLEGDALFRREGVYLGCFDVEPERGLEFIPVSRRPETTPPGM